MMSNGTLPDYLKMASPNPMANRTPWYKSTAPTYAGIFLWVVFYKAIAVGTLPQAGLALSLLGLVVAALICHFLFYLVPGLYGMKTGYPLYVIGSSTYGTLGGFLIPGLLMGLLQFGWLGVNVAISSDFILQAAGKPPAVDPATGVFGASIPFTIVAIFWGLAAAFIGVKGIQFVARVASLLPIVPLAMIIIVFVTNVGTAGDFQVAADAKPMVGFLAMIAMVVGFFATAGAAGVDFGMGNRNAKDIHLGGLFGIALAIVVAGGLPLIAIAGAHGAGTGIQGFEFDAVIGAQGGFLAKSMFILFAIASFAPACFSSFIAANSIGTMFPKANKMAMVFVGAIISIVLGATGVAFNLESVFGLIGASFGPICGSMVADYLLSGCKWLGPRKGINLAGYIAWVVGFLVAILPNSLVWQVAAKAGLVASATPPDWVGYITPAPVIAFVIGFVLYAILAKVGLEPPAVQMPASKSA